MRACLAFKCHRLFPVHRCFLACVCSSSPSCLIICSSFKVFCLSCFFNESGSFSSFSGSTKCCFLSTWSRLSLRSSCFLKPVTSDTPSHLLSLGGWLSHELRLTFQLHFDPWPCCCRLFSPNPTCHSLTWRPLYTASHPPIFALLVLSSRSLLSVTYQGYTAYFQSTHTKFNGKRWKDVLTESFLKPRKGIWESEVKSNSAAGKQWETEQQRITVRVDYSGTLRQSSSWNFISLKISGYFWQTNICHRCAGHSLHIQ